MVVKSGCDEHAKFRTTEQPKLFLAHLRSRILGSSRLPSETPFRHRDVSSLDMNVSCRPNRKTKKILLLWRARCFLDTPLKPCILPMQRRAALWKVPRHCFLGIKTFFCKMMIVMQEKEKQEVATRYVNCRSQWWIAVFFCTKKLYLHKERGASLSSG